ncbi:serine/arginine repetitive matrix protein 1-like [Lontra canadensis]|uniref:serine/arginine repetitive matrix protein 1-like n=1 Tax=Lontra canadensis TaxID=76717 RepID=UPI0013F31C99|nr:serine/arginine repetitive matrix protein 1-like [Lontra canadensis]
MDIKATVSCSFSIFSALASSASGPVNANVLRDSNQAALTPRDCSGPNPPRRTSAHTLGSLRASDSENPAARECKVSEGQRGLPAHRQSLPRRRNKTARLVPRLRRDRHGRHARPRGRGTSRIRSFSTAPGSGHPARRPLPAPKRMSQRARGPGQRQRRSSGSGADSVRKRDTHQRQPRALTAPEVVTRPLPGSQPPCSAEAQAATWENHVWKL